MKRRKISLTKEECIKILESQNYRCAYCDAPFGQIPIQWDHLIPYSFLQKHIKDNWVASCPICNMLKSNFMFKSLGEAREYVQNKRKTKHIKDLSHLPETLSNKISENDILLESMPVQKMEPNPQIVSQMSAMRICPQCGQEFKLKKYDGWRRKYCGKTCKRKANGEAKLRWIKRTQNPNMHQCKEQFLQHTAPVNGTTGIILNRNIGIS